MPLLSDKTSQIRLHNSHGAKKYLSVNIVSEDNYIFDFAIATYSLLPILISSQRLDCVRDIRYL